MARWRRLPGVQRTDVRPPTPSRTASRLWSRKHHAADANERHLHGVSADTLFGHSVGARTHSDGSGSGHSQSSTYSRRSSAREPKYAATSAGSVSAATDRLKTAASTNARPKPPPGPRRGCSREAPASSSQYAAKGRRTAAGNAKRARPETLDHPSPTARPPPTSTTAVPAMPIHQLPEAATAGGPDGSTRTGPSAHAASPARSTPRSSSPGSSRTGHGACTSTLQPGG